MGNFNKYSNYNEKSSFSSVVFGADSPVLEVELNEMQQILNTKLNRLIKTLGYGLVPNSADSFTFNASTSTVTLKDVFVIDRNGFIAYIDSASVVVSATNNITYIKMQESEATISTPLKSYGNTNGASISNPIKDNRLNVETTRRRVITYTLISGESFPVSTNTERYISVGSYDATNNEFVFEPWGVKDLVIKNSLSLFRKPNSAVGVRSTSLGYKNAVSGSNSFAYGYENSVSGNQSASFGSANQCLGDSSLVSGYSNIANYYQVVFGHLCDESLNTSGEKTGTTGTALAIGNGFSTAKSNALRVQYDGKVYAKGAYNATGADYAEYAEWADGNPDNEDRRGYFVTFDEEKPNMIRKAKADDIDILGVVSGNPCIVGNADECWTKKFLTDDFGNYLYETTVEKFEVFNEETEEFYTEEREVTHYILNPDFNEEHEYIHRSERPEWSAIGWIGVLPVRDDGTCEVGGYCTYNDEGVATKSLPSRFNYRVIERVSENIVKVVIK